MTTMPVELRSRTTVHVVFVHGLFSSVEVWDQFRKLLAADEALRGVVAHCFPYGSRKIKIRPDRAIAEYDDIADSLRTYLRVQIPRTGRVVLVSHSQGGLIVQRFLARTLHEAQGPALSRIAQIVMFACPNHGSTFFLSLRRSLFFWRHPQERQLRPYQRDVLETERTVMRAIVGADRNTESGWHIPIQAYGGTEDAVVPAREARGVFPDGATVPGDHFQIVQPADHDSASYRVLRDVLLELLEAEEEPTAPGPAPAVPPRRTSAEELPGPARSQGEELPPQQGGVSVSPPYGRREVPLHGRAPRGIIAGLVAAPAAGEPRVRVLTGLGGSGKSRIALEAAHRTAGSRRVWWVTVPQINTCMREVARQLGAPTGEIEQAFRGDGSPMDLVWRYLEDCPHPWLLVIDNADTPDRLASEASRVADGTGWIRQPVRADGLVVVTSRDRSAAGWLPPCVVHEVPPLEAEEGAALLLEAAPRGGTRRQARELSKALGGLPLALYGAASYLNSVHRAAPSLDDPVIHDFDSYREVFKARSASPPGTAASGLEEMLGMSAMAEVCGIALDLLARRGLPQAGPLLRVFACLGIAPIPYRPLLESTAIDASPLLPDFDRRRRNAVLKGLDDLGLVERAGRTEPESGLLTPSLTLHPVVHALLRGDAEMERRRSDYYGLLVDLLLDVTRLSPPDEPPSWDLWTAIAPHAMEVVRDCVAGDQHVRGDTVLRDALELARRTLRYLIAVGLLRPAQELATAVLDNCDAIGFQPDDDEILEVRHEKARIALESGDYSTAESDLRAIVTARQELLGAEDRRTLASRHKLARSILEQFRFDEAERLLRSVAESEMRVHGPDHSDTVTVRHSLARAMFALGRTSEAEAELREILRISLDKWSPSTMETLRIRQTLARCLMKTQRPDEAADIVRQALQDTTQGSDSVLAMTLRHTWCQVLLCQGEIPRAHQETERLLDDRRRVLGPHHPETVRNRRLLIALEDLLDRPDRAERKEEKAGGGEGDTETDG
ncbi:alpha/beta fold hydrolase [Streptomyces sp. NPDC090994]|uniref:alpha/beta hydrolase n=1 Tax=Streptomyces sp. NPDC090994 TaxID=3365969 RepID=UPI00382C8863